MEIRDSRNERRERNSTSNVTSMETQLLSFLPPLPTLHLVSGLFPNELGTVDDDRKMRFSARIMRVPSRDVNMASELRRFGDQPTNSPSGGFSFLSLFSQPLMIYSAQEERREGKINLNYLRDLRRFIHSRSFSLLFFLHCHSLSLCLCLRNSLLSGERTKFQRAKSEREGGRDISALIGSGCRKRSNV